MWKEPPWFTFQWKTSRVSKVYPLIERKLELIMAGKQRSRITMGNEYPPCFDGLTQYAAWLDASDPDTGSKPPPRRDWPNEPNYCRDCSGAYRSAMRQQGRCLFPNMQFVSSGDGEDAEIIGIAPE